MDGGLEPAVRHLKAHELRSKYSRRSPQYSIVLPLNRATRLCGRPVIVPYYWKLDHGRGGAKSRAGCLSRTFPKNQLLAVLSVIGGSLCPTLLAKKTFTGAYGHHLQQPRAQNQVINTTAM